MIVETFTLWDDPDRRPDLLLDPFGLEQYQIVEEDPGNAEAWYYRGILLYQTGRKREATGLVGIVEVVDVDQVLGRGLATVEAGQRAPHHRRAAAADVTGEEDVVAHGAYRQAQLQSLTSSYRTFSPTESLLRCSA